MNNKLQIIETPDYILAVSDEEIKESEKDFFIIANDRDKTWINRLEKVIECKIDPKHGKVLILSSGFIYVDEGCKIIAYQPKGNAPELNLPLLPEIVIEDDVEKLFKKEEKGYYSFKDNYNIALDWFKKGHKTATKVYSEDDLIQLAGELSFKWHNGEIKDLGSSIGWSKRYVESLKQPKPKWFVAEYKTEYTEDGLDYQSDELKTTTINGKTYLVGTYINE
jgi:hypothetical protein